MSSERATAFKVGFLKKVAELGLTPELFVKQAIELSDIAGSVLGGAGGAAGAGLKGLGTLALGAPIVAGGLAGAADAALNAPSGDDIEALRKAEMVGLLNRLTSEVKSRRPKGPV